MSKSIGIDLGTTNSVMCVMKNEPEIILNRENGRLTPSVVAFRRSKKTGDQIIVGKLARDYAKMARKDFLYSVKRLIGRSYNDPEVAKVKERVTYEIVPSPAGVEDEVRVKLGGQLYEPKEIAAMILKKMKEDAELRLGEPVDSAVITVPAYFSERQKNATREAGLLAGLKVKKIIDEPTAAAIAYGIDNQDDQDRMVLVFDLGGGTFDVSILLMVGGIFSQMDNEGDMWLGGDDFDRIITEQVIRYVEAEEGLANLHQNEEFMLELRTKAREAKEGLSSQDSTEIIITDALKDEDGLPLPVECEVTRDEFNQMLGEHVVRAESCVTKALKEANLDFEDIDAVLMVGGSSTIPAFQDSMEKMFGAAKVLRGIDPMICVAQGAGVLAKSLAGIFCTCGQENPLDADSCGKCGADLSLIKSPGGNAGAAQPADEVPATMMVETYSRTPKHYGIEIEGGAFEVLIPKNTIYPTDEPSIKHFRTTMTGQRLIKVPVYEGEDDGPNLNDKTHQGNIWFYDLPPNLPVGQVMEVSMNLDSDMIFTIGCRARGIDWSREVQLVRAKWKNDILDEAMNAQVEAQQMGVGDTGEREVIDHVRGIGEALEQENEEKARQHMKELRQAKEKHAQAQQPQADWKIQIQNILFFAENNLDPLRPALASNTNELPAYDAWAQAARAALEAGDETPGLQLGQTGLPKLLAVPVVGDLVVGQIITTVPQVDSAIKQNLLKAYQEVFKAFQANGATQMFLNVFKAYQEVLKQAMEQLNQSGAAPPEIKVLLGRA